MFARRKPKPQDDEPLVPHGLIWQATEEPMSPSKLEGQQESVSPSPIEMPKFWRKPVQLDPTVRRAPGSVTVNKQSDGQRAEKSQPVSLAPVQELTKRRMLIEEERAQREPIPVEAKPEMKDSAPVDEWLAVESKAELKSSTEAASPSVLVSQVVIETSITPAQLSETVRPTINEPEPAEVPRGSRRIQESIGKAAETGLLLAKESATVLRHTAQTIGSLSRQAWNHRVRIKFAAGTQLRTVFSAVLQVRVSAATSWRKNRRLLTSMGMAGASALLALGVVIGVKNDGPSRQNLVRNAIPPSTLDATRATAKPQAATSTAPVTFASTNTKIKPVQSTAPIVQAAARKPIRKRRTPDDDYVARDTYVVYRNR